MFTAEEIETALTPPWKEFCFGMLFMLPIFLIGWIVWWGIYVIGVPWHHIVILFLFVIMIGECVDWLDNFLKKIN
jgi:hypothetical protein